MAPAYRACIRCRDVAFGLPVPLLTGSAAAPSPRSNVTTQGEPATGRKTNPPVGRLPRCRAKIRDSTAGSHRVRSVAGNFFLFFFFCFFFFFFRCVRCRPARDEHAIVSAPCSFLFTAPDVAGEPRIIFCVAGCKEIVSPMVGEVKTHRVRRGLHPLIPPHPTVAGHRRGFHTNGFSGTGRPPI